MIGQALKAYDDAGRIVWAEDDEAALAAAIDKVLEWRTAHPGDSTAIVTEWNGKARKASALLREQLKLAGQIAAEDVELAIVARGYKDACVTIPMSFATGEEIIFGENVKLAQRTIRNNDLAQIVALDAIDPADPSFVFRFEDGQEVLARFSQLVGRREEGEARALRMQHSYVTTVHSSQGATYARTVDLTLEGHGREATLVASTRHTLDHYNVVAIDRLAQMLEAKTAATITLGRGAALFAAPEEDDESQASQAALEDVKRAFLAESAGHDPFGNISDHFADIHAWAGIVRPPESKAPIAAAPPVEVMELRRQAMMKQRPMHILREQEMGKAREAANQLKAPVARPGSSKTSQNCHVTEEERSAMERVDLLAFASQELGGVVMETRRDEAGGAVAFGTDVVGIFREGDRWFWTKRSGAFGRSSAGVIYNLVQWVRGLSYRESLLWLRKRLGTFRPRPVELTSAAGEKATASPMKSRAEVVGWFGTLPRGSVSTWLVQRRGILPAVCRRFATSIRAEWTGNRFGVAFAHRDASGGLVGVHRRGPGRAASKNQNSFVGMVGERALFQEGELLKPSRFYVSETTIDSLSLYQHDGQPEGASVLATDGSLNAAAQAIICALAAKHTGAVWHVARNKNAEQVNRDPREFNLGGFRHQQLIIEAIRRGNAEARIEVRDPSDGCEAYRDWNDRLRGPDFSVASKATAINAALREQQERDATRLVSKAKALHHQVLGHAPRFAPRR